MDYDIVPAGDIVTNLASSTTNYMAVLSPIFLFVIGIVLAVAIISMLIELFNDWLYENTILNEYTSLRQEEAEISGGVFGDFKAEKAISRRMIRAGNINDSVTITTAGDRLEQIENRKRTLQSDF